MKRASVLISIVCCAAACAGVAERKNPIVRDLDGNPLPPYAFTASEGPVFKVRCGDGNSYLVVTNPPPGINYRSIIRLVRRDPNTVCDRILATRL